MRENRVISFLKIMVAVVIFCTCTMTDDVRSAIPETINYQGYLTDSGGTPVNTPKNMTFKIYTVASGGTALWTETQSNVPVNEGVYNVVLGSVTSLGALPFDVPYFLGVTVSTDAEMTPRQPLTSVAYALTADTALNVANNVVTSTMIQDGTVSSADVNFNYAGSTSKGGPATGLTCAGCVSQSTLSDSAVNSAKIENGSILFGDIGGNGCTPNQIMKYSGSAWACAADVDTDTNTTYTAGTGLDLVGTEFRVETPLSLSGSSESAGIIIGINGSTANISTGVLGFSSATSGATFGVQGQSNSTSGYGIYGIAAASTGSTSGAYGKSVSTSGTGVYGLASAGSGTTYGVYGQSQSTGGSGVYGWASADTVTTTYGVYGISDSTLGKGVYGIASADTGRTSGVYGMSESSDGYGGYFVNTKASGVALKAANSGIIQSSAKSYVWISGNGAKKFGDTDTTIINMTNFGGAVIQRGGADTSKYIILPITVTSPLYGQAVTISKVDIYWKGETPSEMIWSVLMRRQTGVCTSCYESIIGDVADYTCASGTYPEGCTLSLTPTGNNILTADSGILYLTIELEFSSATTQIWIGGVRLTLEHE